MSNSVSNNNFSGYEQMVADIFLFAHISGIFLYYTDIKYFSFIILNPLFYIIMGVMVMKNKRVYLANNDFSYFTLEGEMAERYGELILLLGLVSLAVFNLLHIFHPDLESEFVIIQLVLSLALPVYMSWKYGVINR